MIRRGRQAKGARRYRVEIYINDGSEIMALPATIEVIEAASKRDAERTGRRIGIAMLREAERRERKVIEASVVAEAIAMEGAGR